MAAKDAILGQPVECLAVGVIGADGVGREDVAGDGKGDRGKDVGGIGPVRCDGLVGHVQAHAVEFSSLTVERKAEGTFISQDLGEKGRADLSNHGGSFRARGNAHVFAASQASHLLALLNVQNDLGRHELDALVLDGFEYSLGAAAKCAGPLLVRHKHLGDIPLDFGVDHSCATDFALASLLADAIWCGDLAISVQRLCRRGGNRYKRTIFRCRGGGITAERKKELPELGWRQLFRVLPEAVAHGTQKPP